MVLEILSRVIVVVAAGFVAFGLMYFFVTQDFLLPMFVKLRKHHKILGFAVLAGFATALLFLLVLAGFAVSARVFIDVIRNWDARSLLNSMDAVTKIVIIGLLVMSAWSIGVMIDRWLAFSAARKQSCTFAPLVAGALREGKIDEAIRIAERQKKSHLAKVVTAGLQEFQAHQASAELSGEEIEASKRALERASAIVNAEMKRGLSGLATIGATAPFVGLVGTVVGIIKAFKGISTEKATGLTAVAGGISEALVATAIGLFVAIPAVMLYNYFTTKIEAFDVEMDNSSSQLIDYFVKRSAPNSDNR